MGFNCAIDGPSGAGKSTIAKAVAKKLGYVYVDTGALYRSIGLFAVKNGVKPSDRENVLPLLKKIELELKYIDGTQRVILNGEDVSGDIRTAEISMAASDISAIPEVREFLLSLQRTIAQKNNIIMDGRDIATVILPNAEVKIFLTASAEERAKRRHAELAAKGQVLSFEEVLKDINQRDYNDSHRETAPLKQADDAVLLDTSDLNIDEATEAALRIIDEKLNAIRLPQKTVPKLNLFFYRFVRAIAALVVGVPMKVSYEGTENIPKSGSRSYIVAPNHHTVLDPVAVAIKIPNVSAYMAKDGIFEHKIAILLKLFHAFPVKRGKGDRSALALSTDYLNRGYNLTIFPEGTRSKDGKIGKAKSGIAYVANEAAADVLPVGITMRKTRFGRKHLIIRYGKLIPYYRLKMCSSSSSELRRVRDIVMDEIKGLVYDE